MTTTTIKDVEVFAVGQWNGRKFDHVDLDDMVDAFDQLQLANSLPIKLGHGAPDTEPAQGWISALRRDGDKLKATLTQVPVELVDDIREGRWRHVSIELLRDVIANGTEYPWVPSGLAILGSASPAVNVLRPLNELIARALPAGLQFRERMAFSRAPDETELLKAEVARLNQELVKREFDEAVRAGRILPRDSHAFFVRMGASATPESARHWIASTPKPQPVNRPGVPAARVADDGESPQFDAPPDVELVRLSQAEVKRSGVSYFAAQRVVLKAHPELADKYRYQPGVKDQ